MKHETLATTTTATADRAWRAVRRYTGVWTSPPTRLINGETVDAPLLGNGDIGVAVAGPVQCQTLFLGKNDFWSARSHAVRPLGRILLEVAGFDGASYRMEQDIARAEVRGSATRDGRTLTTRTWVDAHRGLLVVDVDLDGGEPRNLAATLLNGHGGTPSGTADDGVLGADLVADTGEGDDPRARMSARFLDGAQTVSGNTVSTTLRPGATATLAVGIVTSIDSPTDWRVRADALVRDLTADEAAARRASHRDWWKAYWSRSFVEIPDKAVERSWYGSLYLLACASRPGRYAPGIWGNWITGEMNWNGDYHTNYNYQAPFYAALSTNRIAQMDCYDQPVLDWQARGQELAAAHGFKGVLYPVGLSPRGASADTDLYQQKSDAANLASDMVMRFQYTGDTAYAERVYPWLKQVGLFWEDYLVWDADRGRYVIVDDAPHEGQPYPQTNSGLSLGLVDLLLRGLIDMSTALDRDADARTTWEHIRAHLSPLVTMERNGRTILRETEVGSDFVDDGNCIDVQSFYPGSLIGLDSDPELLAAARNTVGALTRAWHGGNAPATFYAAAARVGYDPAALLAHLHLEATEHSYPNLAVHHAGGGLENVNVTTSGLNEMLLQSFQGNLKFFPTWPADADAAFGDLLAHGNVLVSSATAGGTVRYIHLVSQNGGEVTVTNPWPGTVRIYRDGEDAGTAAGSRITLATGVGETVDLAPDGTPLAAIQRELSRPET